MKSYTTALVAILFATAGLVSAAETPTPPQVPQIVKKGVIAADLCETTPFVFKGKVYRLEWHRKANRLRIMDRDAQTEVSNFGKKHAFSCAFVDGDTVHVFGTLQTQRWTGDILTQFTSKDLVNWEERVIFKHPQGKPFCNTTVCKADGRYVMSYEQNEGGFHAQFLESKDLVNWTMLPNEQRHQLGRYCAPHCLRFNDGWFYLFYLEAGKPHGYEQYVTRSRDLIHWTQSPFNPVLAASPEDKIILNAALTAEERDHVAKAKDSNNSDIDFCEFNGKLLITYSWGNQNGTEFIAEAEYAGTASQFLSGWFPDDNLWRGIDITRPLNAFAKDRATYGRVLSADGATMKVSSGRMTGDSLLLGGGGSFAFHTDAERNPWVTIDLGAEKDLTGIFIRNRTDTAQERAATLRLKVSSDGQQWNDVWQAAGAEPSWEIPLTGKSLKARYVRLETQPKSPTHFHLQHLEVWGK